MQMHQRNFRLSALLLIPVICLLAYFSVGLISGDRGPTLLTLAIIALIFTMGMYDIRYFFYSMIVLTPFAHVQVPYVPLRLSVALVVAVAGFAIFFIRCRRIPQTPLNKILLAYITIMALSIIQTYVFASLEPPDIFGGRLGIYGSRHRGWYHLVIYIVMLAIPYFTYLSVNNLEHFKKTVAFFLKVTLAVVLFCYYEFLAKLLHLPLITIATSAHTRPYVSKASFVFGGIRFPRVYGTFFEPSGFSNYLLIGFAFCLSSVLWNIKTGGRSRKQVVLLSCIILAIILTFSTAGWVCALIILAVLAYFHGFKQIVPLIIVVMVGILLITTLLSHYNISEIESDLLRLQHDKLTNFLFGSSETSHRVGGREVFWNIFKNYPVLGVGLGNEIFYSDSPDKIMGSFNHYLTVISETGLIGFFVFGCFLVKIYSILQSTLKSARRHLMTEVYPFVYAMIAAYTGILVFHICGLNRFFIHEWFLIGLSVCIHNVVKCRIENKS